MVFSTRRKRDMRYSTDFQNPVYRLAGLSLMVIFLWGVTAWLRMLAGGIPPLELTGLTLACAAVCSGLVQRRRVALTKAVRIHRWYVWPVVGGSLVGASTSFYTALALAPAAQVVVITYTWPLLFAISGDFFNHRRPAALTLVALLVGLAGVVVMHGVSQAPSMSALL